MVEELVINMIANAPAVVVLFYLVVRLDNRLCEMQDALIDLLKQGKER